MNRQEKFKYALPSVILIAATGFVAIGKSVRFEDEVAAGATTNFEAVMPERVKMPGQGFNTRVHNK